MSTQNNRKLNCTTAGKNYCCWEQHGCNNQWQTAVIQQNGF